MTYGDRMCNLEPGCKAIVVGSSVKCNIGKLVKVCEFIGEVKDFVGDDRWVVDMQIVSKFGEIVNHTRARYLQRIDDPENDEIKETEKELEITI